MSREILIVEDDANVRDLVHRYLSSENFCLIHAANGEQALEFFVEHQPSMVMLDLLLPDMNGMLVCEKIRETSDVPIIMLTALNEEVDLLSGFGKGADDYIAKPFNPRELVARVHALMRRVQPSHSASSVSYGDIFINPDERVVTCGGRILELTQLEFNILHLLVAAPNKVFSREDLLNSSHASFAGANARSIDFHIKNLRRKLNSQNGRNYIATIYGVGFRLK